MLFICTLIEFDTIAHYCFYYAPTREMGGAPVNGTSFDAYSAKISTVLAVLLTVKLLRKLQLK